MTERDQPSYDFEPRTPELPQEYQETFVERQPDRHYLIGCGDDREPVDAGEEYLRFFGGAAGIAKIVMLARASKEGGAAVKDSDTYSESISKIAHDIMKAQPNMEPVLHSAQDNENGASTFQPDSEKPLGCAYGAGFVAVSGITLTPGHQHLSTTEDIDLFGRPSPRSTAAHQQVIDHFGADSEHAGMSRGDFADIDLKKQILAGHHAKPEETLVSINFTPNLVSNPALAHEKGKPFYNNDVTQVAEAIIRAYPKEDFDPETLLRLMVEEIRATRAALAGGDATDLAVYRIGSPAEAIDYLNEVKTDLSTES